MKTNNIDILLIISGGVLGVALSVYFGLLMGIPGYISGAIIGFFAPYSLAIIVDRICGIIKKIGSIIRRSK